MKTSIFNRIIVAFALLLETVQLFATNYYVSNTGKNTDPGSFSKPFGTIQYALNKASVPGDTVFVRAGTYFEQLNFPYSGSSQKSIVLTNYANEGAIVDGSKIPLTENNFVKILAQSNLVVKGLKFRNFVNRTLSSAGFAIIGGSTNVKVLNNEFQDFSPQDTLWGEVRGISVFSFNKQPVTNCLISGNKFLRIVCGESEVIDNVGYVSDFEISDNEVTDASCNPILQCGGGYAIPFNGYYTDSLGVPNNGVFRNNYIHDNIRGYGTKGVYIDGGTNMIIENNLIVNNVTGISVSTEERRAKTNNIIIRNNVLYDNYIGVSIGNDSINPYDSSRLPGAVDSVFIYNNTVINNKVGISLQCEEIKINKLSNDSEIKRQRCFEIRTTKTSNIYLYNNIFWQKRGGCLNPLIYCEKYIVPNFVLNNNLYYTGDTEPAMFLYRHALYNSIADFQKKTGNEAYGKYADPEFVSFPTNLSIKASSPAVDAGTTIMYAKTDFNGSKRPFGKAPDMGAYEYGNNPADIIPPSVPWNLTTKDITSTGFTLNWAASYDNSGVVAYEVFVGGVLAGTTTSNSLIVKGLAASTAYKITVKAKDAAGNVSPASTELIAATDKN